jgi:hypothetical protein
MISYEISGKQYDIMISKYAQKYSASNRKKNV